MTDPWTAGPGERSTDKEWEPPEAHWHCNCGTWVRDGEECPECEECACGSNPCECEKLHEEKKEWLG
jgi:hypothetical protein